MVEGTSLLEIALEWLNGTVNEHDPWVITPRLSSKGGMPRYLQSQTRNCPPKRGNFKHLQYPIPTGPHSPNLKIGQDY